MIHPFLLLFALLGALLAWATWIKFHLPRLRTPQELMNIITSSSYQKDEAQKIEAMRLKARWDRGLQYAIFNSPSIRYAWEDDEMWLKRTGGFAVDKHPQELEYEAGVIPQVLGG